jgi:glycosyltransferase involved in cell wall biosynthesis
MNIWLATIGETLPLTPSVRKMRTAMLADHLAARGHKVRWWVSAFEHQRRVMLYNHDQEVPLSPGLTLQVLRGCGYATNISPARYLDHRIIAGKFRRQARKLEPPHIIIASMPCHHLAFEAVRYGRGRKIPVLVDVRDLWPDIFLTRIKQPLVSRLARRMLTGDFSRLHTLMHGADGLIAVSRGYLHWALEKAARSENAWDRVFLLGYKAPQASDAGSQVPHLPAWLQGQKDKKLLLFIGTFGVSYELRLVVEAARRLASAGRHDVCFVLAGTGEQAEVLRRKSAGLSNVLLPGWVEATEIALLLRKGYLGLVPCRSEKDTLPNKPFEYLSMGLPLISSLEGEMAELINTHGLGLNYRPGDLEGLCQALETLLDTQELRDRLSANAQAFFKEYGDADHIYAKFAAHVERVAEASMS